MKKCDYCAKEISYFEQYCDENCQANANKYYEKCQRFEGLFSIVNTICVFGIPVGIFLFPFLGTIGAVVASASCIILGILILFLPFPTEGTISKHKIQKAIKLTRIFGGILIAFGILMFIFMVFLFLA
ncbi:MAG: hypothetical protein U0L20_03580 [Ruminococcus sp.]|nr:hypothetical protein [Ruminococcus sp.]